MTPRKLLEICFWLIIALLVIPSYVNMGWQYSMDRIEDPQNIGGMDFKAYYVAAQLAREGMDFYDWPLGLDLAESYGIAPDGSVYIYPPPFALSMIPLTGLPIQTAARVWFLTNLILLAVSLTIMIKTLEIRRGLPLLLMGALLFTPVSYNLHMGQVNILILFLITASYALLKRRKDIGGGVAIGLASLVKVAPGVLIAYFFWKRKYRAFLAALAAMALLSLASAVALEAFGGPGWSSIGRYVTQILPQLGRARPNPYNQSFNGLFSLTLLANPYFTPVVDSPALWQGMVAACTLLLVGGTIWLIPRRERGTMDLEMALVVSALLPMASITWTSTLTLLLFPYAALAGRWLRQPHSLSIGLGALSFALINSQRILEVTVGWEWAQPWVFGSAWITKLPLLGTLLVWAVVALTLRMKESQ